LVVFQRNKSVEVDALGTEVLEAHSGRSITLSS
jgi:hypothetical protein